jgi:hypothetical protein
MIGLAHDRPFTSAQSRDHDRGGLIRRGSASGRPEYHEAETTPRTWLHLKQAFLLSPAPRPTRTASP